MGQDDIYEYMKGKDWLTVDMIVDALGIGRPRVFKCLELLLVRGAVHAKKAGAYENGRTIYLWKAR